MAKERVLKAGKVPGHLSVEGQVETVNLDERIVDPNDPRAVQIPESGVGGRENVLDVHLELTPNEAAGDEPEVQINPHTGENVDEATTPSPVPPNVDAVESVEDVLKPEDVTQILVPDEDKVQPDEQPAQPTEPETPSEPTPAEPEAPAPEPEPTPAEPEAPAPEPEPTPTVDTGEIGAVDTPPAEAAETAPPSE